MSNNINLNSFLNDLAAETPPKKTVPLLGGPRIPIVSHLDELNSRGETPGAQYLPPSPLPKGPNRAIRCARARQRR